MPFIEVKDLCKDYQILQRQNGFGGYIKSLFHPVYLRKKAVKNINFSIEKGESVGYIGMNGAGKSTTIKMMSGVLTPTSGRIRSMASFPTSTEARMHGKWAWFSGKDRG